MVLASERSAAGRGYSNNKIANTNNSNDTMITGHNDLGGGETIGENAPVGSRSLAVIELESQLEWVRSQAAV